MGLFHDAIDTIADGIIGLVLGGCVVVALLWRQARVGRRDWKPRESGW